MSENVYAKAKLRLSKAHFSHNMETGEKTLPQVTLDILEVKEDEEDANVILSPRIDLSGEAFPKWLESGRDALYDVSLIITVEETPYEHKGISAIKTRADKVRAEVKSEFRKKREGK